MNEKMDYDCNRMRGLFQSIVLVILLFLPVQFCAPSFGGSDYYDFTDISTEPPDLVERFNPQQLASRAVVAQQIEIEALKLVTEVKLRYAQTLIEIHLKNPYTRELQADFQIVLPENAFFTGFDLKKRNKTYSATIVEKEAARNIFHFALHRTNGTISAGYIELSPRTVDGLPVYNVKFTVAAEEHLEAFLVYERLLERVSSVYTDKIQVFPSNPVFNLSTIGEVAFTVNVEELGAIKLLKCKPEMEENFSKCRSEAEGKNMKLFHNDKEVAAFRLQKNSFQFEYELEHQNETTTAVMISQRNGNSYFVHLFLPENLPPTRKHFLFLLDVSDSMHGKKLEQLQWSMVKIMNDLGPQDFFNIVAFSNDVTVLSKYWGNRRYCHFPFPATYEYKQSAVAFIKNKLIAHGTTNIFLGLSKAFYLANLFSPHSNDTCPDLERMKLLKAEMLSEKLPDNVESMIFFLSDGKPTSGPRDSASLLRYFHNLNHGTKTKPPIQINTIAYGEDADMNFLKALSKMNGGVTKVISEESDAVIELTNFYREISSQVLSQLQTEVVTTNNGTVSLQFTSPVTVVNGGEVLTTGMLFPHSGTQNQTFSPTLFNWTTEGIGKSGKLAYYNSPVYDCRTLNTTIGKCVERIDFYVERLQAYQLLQKFLERDKWVELRYICPQTYDAFQDLKMMEYNSENDIDCYNIYKQKVIELALKHGFVTPYTSFILTTEQIDSGLKSGNEPVLRVTSTDEESKETPFLPYSKDEAPDKLFERSDSAKLKLMSRQIIDPSLLEILPTASRLVDERIENDDQRLNLKDDYEVLSNVASNHIYDNSIGNLNSTKNSTSTNSEKGQTKLSSLRDFTVRVFAKLFNVRKRPTNS